MNKRICYKFSLLLLLFLFGSIYTTQAQFWKKLEKRVTDGVEEAIIRKTEEKSIEKTENAIDSVFKAPKKVRKKKRKKNGKRNNPQNENEDYDENEEYNEDENSEEYEDETELQEPPKAWTKYNFVPGDEIIFEDNLSSEENGEFPSRWDLNKGNAENASLGDENIIRLEKNSIITPLMDAENYLPEVFTIEFDAYFGHSRPTYQAYKIRFWNSSTYLTLPNGDWYDALTIQSNGARTEYTKDKADKKLAGFDEATIGNLPAWKHISISFNKRTLKVFVDEYRALNIPNYKLKPELFTIESYLWSSQKKITFAIKNIRIAKGGKNLYDRVMADGKFVTRGILFDVNRASIKPESYGVLNTVAKMMKAHQDLNFKIEGHTDSDGNDQYNLNLSAKRADAVRTALQELGISEDRLKTEGKGETTPVSDNTTPEGKANNRRVEFIKI